MKKTLLCALVAGVFAAACASTGTTPTNNTAQTITLEQALQKSAETRQQLEQAKQSYQAAKTAAEVASGSQTVSQAVQNQVQKQINTAKTQVQAEKDAWADLLK